MNLKYISKIMRYIMLLHFIILFLKIFFCTSQNVTVCGNITCTPGSTHGCSSDGNECRCLNGYKGIACDEDIDECARAHLPLCGNMGQCVNIGGGFRCICLDGWYGTHCKNKNQSVPAQCLPGWTGSKCDTDINECISGTNDSLPVELCKNSGTCVNMNGSYACNCANGWQGDDCSSDIDECKMSQPCDHNSTCLNTIGSYSCACSPEWKGHNCSVDVNECVISQPCDNNSSCHNTNGSFSCACALGWQGQRCSIDVNECETSQPCGEQSACINSLGSFSCACAPGWQGENCTVDVDECLSSPCGQFQNCTNTIGSFYCICSSTLAGSLCESTLKGQPDSFTNIGLIVGLVIGSLVFLWGAVVAIVLIKYCFCKPRRVTDEGNVTQQDIEMNEKSPEVVRTQPAMPEGQRQEIVMKTKFSINKISP